MIAKHFQARHWSGGFTPAPGDGWRDDTPCSRLDPDLFSEHVEGEAPAVKARRVARAGRVCGGCPVQDVCLEAGRSGAESGVWGGVLLHDGVPDGRKGRKPRSAA